MNLDCPRLISVNLLIDDEITDEERASLSEHLKVCAVCSKELEDLRRLRTNLQSVTADQSIREHILVSLHSRSPARPTVRRMVTVPIPIAVSILFVLGLSLLGNAYMGFQRNGDEQGSLGRFEPSVQQPEMSPMTPVQTNRIAAEAGPPVASTLKDRSNSFTSTAHSGSPRSVKQASKPSIVKLESDRGTIQIFMDTEYRPLTVPRVYAGGFFHPSDER